MSLPKKNIRSVRFSDEMMELIEQQVGANFTQKFERLVYNAYMLSAQKEEYIKSLDSEIERRAKRLRDLNEELYKLQSFVTEIGRKIKVCNKYFDDFIEGDL